MVKRWSDNRMLGRALLVSLFLHACGALIWPNLASPSNDLSAPVENISFAHLTQVKITTPAPKTRSISRAAPVTAKVAPLRAPVHRSGRQQSRKPAPRAPAAIVPEQGRQVAAVPAPSAAPAASAAPSAPPREVAQSDGQDTGGVMPFGATLDTPVLDPRVRSELQNRFKLGVTVVIVVGDDGKTKSISFHPPQDPAVEAQIRSLLASANWDPAVCGGGIACQKSAELKL